MLIYPILAKFAVDMSNGQRLEIEQRTVQRLSQQQVRYVRLLELNAPEFDEAVEREMEDNPALADAEEEQPLEIQQLNGWMPRTRSDEAEDYSNITPDSSMSLYDHLNDQLAERDMPDNVGKAARFIIGSLDSNGYLTRTIRDIVDDMAFGPGIYITEREAGEALRVVQSLEPAGIGAADLKQTLEIQLEAMRTSQVRDDALRIVREAFEAFTLKHRNRIVSQLGIPEPRVAEALDLILSLNPKPGASVGSDPVDQANVVIPDFIISDEDGQLTVTLNNRIPELRVERSFEQAMAELEKLPRGKRKKGSEFIVSRYNDARDFIRIVAQRQKSMMTVMSAILKVQEEYFRTQDVYKLKPMMLKTLAEITGLDFSTISRATNNKFVQTPWGIYPLRFFFSDTKGDTAEGEDAATNRKIEASIKALIDKEDKRKPLSDRRIADMLAASGLDISRRTVAKYRDRVRIPVARLRKEL